MYLTYSTALPHTIYLKKCRIFFLRNAFFASKIFTALWLPLPSKGQIISEAIFLVLNSSKKQTICFQNFAPATRTEVFCSFFWKNRKQEKNLLILTDLYRSQNLWVGPNFLSQTKR